MLVILSNQTKMAKERGGDHTLPVIVLNSVSTTVLEKRRF